MSSPARASRSNPAQPPALAGLDAAVRQAYSFLERAAAARGGDWVNAEGGDVGVHGSHRSVVRHVANYLAAAELAERRGGVDAVVDVGSGVGALGAWLADRLGARLHLVDHDERIRRVAAAAFPAAHVHASLSEAPQAPLVTGMEVIEHISRPEQGEFARAVIDKVAPGGLLVLSTPDETRYLGGWSGYAPHIGVLTPETLERVLRKAGGASVTLWRMDGAPYELGRVRRVAEPLGNRAWSELSRRSPRLAARLGGTATTVAALRDWRNAPVPSDVRAVPLGDGRGTGLLAVAAPGVR